MLGVLWYSFILSVNITILRCVAKSSSKPGMSSWTFTLRISSDQNQLSSYLRISSSVNFIFWDIDTNFQLRWSANSSNISVEIFEPKRSLKFSHKITSSCLFRKSTVAIDRSVGQWFIKASQSILSLKTSIKLAVISLLIDIDFQSTSYPLVDKYVNNSTEGTKVSRVDK